MNTQGVLLDAPIFIFDREVDRSGTKQDPYLIMSSFLLSEKTFYPEKGGQAESFHQLFGLPKENKSNKISTYGAIK